MEEKRVVSIEDRIPKLKQERRKKSKSKINYLHSNIFHSNIGGYLLTVSIE